MMRIAYVLLALGLLGAGCHTGECSPCPPGTRASNPSESCSVCVCVNGGGVYGPCPDGSVDGDGAGPPGDR
jgi:hypothetical protein